MTIDILYAGYDALLEFVFVATRMWRADRANFVARIRTRTE